jgi:hypothetical protein
MQQALSHSEWALHGVARAGKKQQNLELAIGFHITSPFKGTGTGH